MHSYRQAYTLELLSQESCIYGGGVMRAHLGVARGVEGCFLHLTFVGFIDFIS